MKAKKAEIEKIIFGLTVVVFVVMGSMFVVPVPIHIKQRHFPFIVALSIGLFLLGLALIYVVLRKNIKGRIRKYLLLTGFSASGILIAALLHNLIYALASVLSGEKYVADEPFFFLLTLFVFPIGFIVGCIGSLFHFFHGLRRKSSKKS